MVNIQQMYIKSARFYTGRIKKQGWRLVSCPLLRAHCHKLLNWRSNSKMFIYEQESNSRRP